MVSRISEGLKKLAKQIVKEKQMNWIDLEQIEFVARSKNSNRYADIRKMSFPATIYSDKNFVLSSYPTFETLSDKKKTIVMFHELLHIDPDEPTKTITHDVEDFAIVLEQHGIRWK